MAFSGDEPARAPLGAFAAFAPLRHPTFRMLWGAWLVANTCMWMNDVAAAWLMTSLSTSPALVALVSTAATIPMFLLGLPSGALADILDRRRYLMGTQFWVAGVAVASSLALIGGAMSAPLLLILTFANGMGLAMRMPVFAAIVPDLVPRPQMPQALALNAVAMNASRIIGPILAGALIAGAGTVYVYVLNAVLSVLTAFLVWRWRHEPKPSALPGERFLGAIRVGVQYVRQSQRMHIVLGRTIVFFVQSSALTALLPLVARGIEGGNATSFTLLLASMGAGAIASAMLLPRLRQRFDVDQIVVKGSLLQATAAVVVATAPNMFVALPAMLVFGGSWLTVANSLSVSAQMALPDWVRARAMSMFQMALMGSSALGAALWGQVASHSSVSAAVVVAAVTGAIGLFMLRRHRLGGEIAEDLTPTHAWTPPVAAVPIDPNAGPVLVTIEYRIDPSRAEEFRTVMQDSRRARLRHGALAWELFRDSSDPNRYIEYFIDESWVEHLRRFDRVTAADEALRERRAAFHTGESPPVVSRFIADA